MPFELGVAFELVKCFSAFILDEFIEVSVFGHGGLLDLESAEFDVDLDVYLSLVEHF